MSKPNVFHSSLEGAQHGPLGLGGFIRLCVKSGAHTAQPSNFHLNLPDGTLKPAKQIIDELISNMPQNRFPKSYSCHCPFYVHGTAWTGSPVIRPFISAEVAALSPSEIEFWAEEYILRFLDLMAELNVKIVPMFWGAYHGLEAASGYPWGFWQGPNYDLIKEGNERFVTRTQKIREHANNLGIVLCHEIHPGTSASCADDFLNLVNICDGDPALGVNFDPSHCWAGESWETRLEKVGPYVDAVHIKDHRIIPGKPLLSMQSDWKKRGMQFVPLGMGDINMPRYGEALMTAGYPERWCEITGDDSAPLTVEAESDFRDGGYTSAHGIRYVNENLCFPAPKGSFQDNMGEKKSGE